VKIPDNKRSPCLSGLEILVLVWAPKDTVTCTTNISTGSTCIISSVSGRIGSGFYQFSGFISGSVYGIWIRIQEGKNDSQKLEKIKNFHVLKCRMVSFEG
jgi:hypothetical protein